MPVVHGRHVAEACEHGGAIELADTQGPVEAKPEREETDGAHADGLIVVNGSWQLESERMVAATTRR